MTIYVSKESDVDYLHAWAANSTYSLDYLDVILSLEEAIMEAMIGLDKPSEYMHHNSYFIPDLDWIENQEFHMRLYGNVDQPVNPLAK